MPPLLPFLHPNVWIVRIFSLSGLGLGFLAFIVVTAAFARRLWCVYLCPLGALYGLLGSSSVFGLRMDGCSGCGRCNTCPMEAADYRGRVVLAHQCTLCFDYEERCPVEGFSFGVRLAAAAGGPASTPSPPRAVASSSRSARLAPASRQGACWASCAGCRVGGSTPGSFGLPA
ncbi:MAG: 4Fe-4S binding protein [Acidobacteria bacterium]|nr:4Fe-4S binding protein [Acidobacteriota bacterium]